MFFDRLLYMVTATGTQALICVKILGAKIVKKKKKKKRIVVVLNVQTEFPKIRYTSPSIQVKWKGRRLEDAESLVANSISP